MIGEAKSLFDCDLNGQVFNLVGKRERCVMLADRAIGIAASLKTVDGHRLLPIA